MENKSLINNRSKALRKTDVRRSALIKWLCSEYPREEAALQISKAKIWEKAGIITIQYSNGAKDIVEITENGVEQIS